MYINYNPELDAQTLRSLVLAGFGELTTEETESGEEPREVGIPAGFTPLYGVNRYLSIYLSNTINVVTSFM